MQEALLHYIWKNSLHKSKEFIADTGEHIKIIEPGFHNQDCGPDFTNARIEIDNTLWAGNIEIHNRSSDWYNHKHHLDQTYDNVILHVVAENNKECYNSKNRHIPCITISPDINTENKYNELIQSKESIPCRNSLDLIDSSRKSLWLSTLTIGRLEHKISYFHGLLVLTKNNWEEAFFIYLARNFGLKINALPFELLAKSIPVKSIYSQPGNLFRTEAILFGQAGFLEETPIDDYQTLLQREFQYHRSKYKLKPLNKDLWKFLRLRPLNFPTIRIAQISDLLTKNAKLLSRTLASSTLNELKEIYLCKVSDYWRTHYTFGIASAHKKKAIGTDSLHGIIINTVIPVLFAYGEIKNRSELKERAISFLEQLPAENNHIIRTWRRLDFPCHHAAESQALLELTEKYCLMRRCLDCQIGNLLLSYSYSNNGNTD
jgi:hypothetical protein